MAETKTKKITADEFLAWAMAQPEGQRYELCQGEVVAMAPERNRHNLTKQRTWRALDDAVRAGNMACTCWAMGRP